MPIHANCSSPFQAQELLPHLAHERLVEHSKWLLEQALLALNLAGFRAEGMPFVWHGFMDVELLKCAENSDPVS